MFITLSMSKDMLSFMILPVCKKSKMLSYAFAFKIVVLLTINVID